MVENFETGNIYVAFVRYIDQDDGKTRPILIWNHHGHLVFYKITTKFENKPDDIKKKYFPIFDWRDLGLPKPSFIDTMQYYPIEYLESMDNIQYLTKLTIQDKKRFSNFINIQK